MTEKFEKREIVKKSENFSRWYTDVILKAKLADYSPVKGCMVIRPYGFALWENIKSALDKMIKAAGVENAYFPLFIPDNLLKKEKEHVEGFAPELAVVTHGGGKKLAEPLIVRPTSETIMYFMYAKWIKSWRDLPLLINQWCNVVRWEKRTYLFLRTTEFLWQEGHTVHAAHEESKKEVERALRMYIKLCQEQLALPGYSGKKSETEKFPGALTTFTYESLMPDGKVLQGCTSHDLGQNFAKPFAVQFQNKKGKLQFGWQTSWGLTTRIIGALIMTHGDDNGLVLPPKVAPVQVVVIPVYKNKKAGILGKSKRAVDRLTNAGIRVKLDEREEYSLGYKINDWELKGVPLRLEIGEKELAGKKIRAVKRVLHFGEIFLPEVDLETQVNRLLEEIQFGLFKKAEEFLKKNTHIVKDYEEFIKMMETSKGFIGAFWCEDPKCEEKIKEETKATTRLLSLDASEEKGRCIYCNKEAKQRWFFAQAY